MGGDAPTAIGDLLVAAGFRHHAVLEANAFGDLLPGVLSEGVDTYEAEIRAMTAPRNGAPGPAGG